MKALGLVVSDKKIFESCILHSCEVWSKSNEWFQRRSHLNEKVNALTHALTDDGLSQKLTLSTPGNELHRKSMIKLTDRYGTVMPAFGYKELILMSQSLARNQFTICPIGL